MADVVVAGGGLVGQIAGLMLARRGHAVLIVEEDDTDPTDGSAEDDFRCTRPGVPQSHHGHVWRARVARVLREELPDVVDAMLDHGIAKAGIDFGEGFEDDFALMSRRPVFEAVLRRAAGSEPGVEVRTGVHVAGLTAVTAGGVPKVTGVRLEGGGHVPADLVVDGCGRRSRAPKWLEELGAGLGADHYQPCGLHYFARHYRLRPGEDFPNTTFPDGAFTPYGIFLAMAQDSRTFCLAGALSKGDPLRHEFRDAAKFDRVMAVLPRMQDWAATGEPITDVQLMGGLANRRRSLIRNDRPAVEGLVLIGDASLYTNATFGQGAALGLWQAQALAHRSGMLSRDSTRLIWDLETWTSQTLGPRYAAQVAVDEAMIEGLREGVAGGPMMGRKDPGAALEQMAAHGDEEAGAAFYRVDNLLTEFAEELSSKPLGSRVDAYLSTVQEGPIGSGPLPREEFEALMR